MMLESSSFPSLRLLRFDFLEEYVLLRMSLTGDGIQRVDRLRDLVTRVAPSHVDGPVRRRDALVLTQRVADRDLAIVVGRAKAGSIRQRNVRRREVHRRTRYADSPIVGKADAAIVRIGHVEIDGVVGV